MAGGVLGPPAVLPRGQFRAVRRLRGDQGARELLRNPALRVVAVELPRAALDVDRLADFGRAQAAASARPKSSIRRIVPRTSSQVVWWDMMHRRSE